MKVLVAFASRHGSTAGIAERIGDRVRSTGLQVDVLPVSGVTDVAGYDAVVLGSAAYMFHWLKDATSFARHHRKDLACVPLWLFSSGPVGTDDLDDQGRDVFDTTRPKEWADMLTTLHPRGDRVFRGAWDPDAPARGMTEQVMRLLPKARAAMPAGDFREWEKIDDWATQIATELHIPDQGSQ